MPSLSQLLEPFVVPDGFQGHERGLVEFLQDLALRPERLLDGASRLTRGLGFECGEIGGIRLPAEVMGEPGATGTEPDWRVSVVRGRIGSGTDTVHRVPLERFRFHLSAALLHCARTYRSERDPWKIIEQMEKACTIEAQLASLPASARERLGL